MSSLFANPICIIWQNILKFGLLAWIFRRLQQRFLASENLGTLRYQLGHKNGNSFSIRWGGWNIPDLSQQPMHTNLINQLLQNDISLWQNLIMLYIKTKTQTLMCLHIVWSADIFIAAYIVNDISAFYIGIPKVMTAASAAKQTSLSLNLGFLMTWLHFSPWWLCHRLLHCCLSILVAPWSWDRYLKTGPTLSWCKHPQIQIIWSSFFWENLR